MADLATVEQLEAVWRPLSSQERSAAATWIGWASELVRSEVPSVDSRITSGDLQPGMASMVVVSMVRRAMENPLGATRMSASIEDYSDSVSFAAGGDGSALYLTDAERARLSPKQRGAFSITPYVPPTPSGQCWGPLL